MTCEDNKNVGWNAAAPGTRKTLEIAGIEYAFRYCPSGTFLMGSPESEQGRCYYEAQREVTLTRGFWTLETPVTQEMWKALTGGNPSRSSSPGKGRDASRHPVENVSWDDCQAFIAKLNDGGFAPDGFAFRLPSEAEWEYACRAGTTTAYFWGDSWSDDRANAGDYIRDFTTTKVGRYPANAWGLYDTHGNVREWCEDWVDFEYRGLTRLSRGSLRVLRGGAWCDYVEHCRSARRLGDDPSTRSCLYGFRLVLGRKRRN